MSEQQVLPELDEICERETYSKQQIGSKDSIVWSVLDCRERQLRTALASLAQSEAERERLQEAYEQSTYSLGMKVIETATLRADLAREREANQGLRQVVKKYRDHDRKFEGCINYNGAPSRFRGEEDDRCPICIKADALLEPKSAPVATTS